MKPFHALYILFLALFIFACSRKMSDKPKVTVFYSKQIKSLLETKCAPCHMPVKGGRKTDLSNYTEVTRFYEDIYRRIRLDRSNKDYMPFKRDPLNQEEIALFQKWKEEGLHK